MTAGDPTCENPYVLVVEDDCAARDSLSELLREAGYQVTCLQNGREALDHLHAHAPPAVILLDGSMPVMTGWEFRREQQAAPSLAEIPVIMLSGDADLVDQAVVAGVDSYFRKPVDPALLLAALRPFFE